MKKNIHIKSYRSISGWIAVFMSCLFLTCTDDTFENDNSYFPDEAMVRLSITTPGSTIPKPTARLSVDLEYFISDIQVLVFSQERNSYLFKYMVEGQQINPGEENPRTTNFTARLKSSENPIKILIVANSKQAFSSYIPSINTPEEEIRSKLSSEFSVLNQSGIPMYGEKVLPSLDATNINTIDLSMLRAMARVDVEADLDMEKSRPFILESVHIYRANAEVQIIPDQDVLTNAATLKVTAPSIPPEAGRIQPYGKEVNSPGDKYIEKLYLPESLPVNDTEAQHTEATCVIVGGYFNGQKEATYYRIDFNSGIEGHPFGQILRNHRYHFKIKQVTGAGWKTPDEAAENRATLIVVDIKTWENFTTEMYTDGEMYLGVDSRTLDFGYKEDLKKKIGVQSTVPYKVSWTDRGETVTIGENKIISNDYFSLQIVLQPELGDDVSYLLITTLTDNDKVNNPSGNSYHGKLKIEWGNWIFYIDITQNHATYYVTDPSKIKSIRVLSVHLGSAGHLGTTNVAANGNGMRRILANPDYFSPTGIINYVSGFSFNGTLLEMFAYADPTSSNSVYRNYAVNVRSEVYAADVIYLANDNYCSPYSSQIIMEWLVSSPNRVLIVGCDGAGTSIGFLQEITYSGKEYKGLLKDDVDFYYNLSVGTGYQTKNIGNGSGVFNMIHDDKDKEKQEFYNGPFGKVADNTKMKCEDEYFGYTRWYNEETVLPLFKHGNATGFQSMSIGINKQRRVLYFGDASIWAGGTFNTNYNGVAGTLGIISTDVHRFWANTWAWIAHQVIWGDDELIEK